MGEEDRDFQEVFEEWQNHHGFHQFEGESGVERFSQLCEDIGYGDRFGTPIEAFLGDNPGAIEAMLEFISNHADRDWIDWKDRLLESLPEEEETEDEDTEEEED